MTGKVASANSTAWIDKTFMAKGIEPTASTAVLSESADLQHRLSDAINGLHASGALDLITEWLKQEDFVCR